MPISRIFYIEASTATKEGLHSHQYPRFISLFMQGINTFGCEPSTSINISLRVKAIKERLALDLVSTLNVHRW
jgi:hypothetical protein